MSIYQHFRKEEHAFIDRVLQWKEQVLNEYTYKLLDFLNPREVIIIKNVIGNKSDVKCTFWGGYKTAERKRAILYPDYYTPNREDFDLVLFSIQYPAKFVTITHPEILGSMMGLGLKREKFGDIVVNDHQAQIIVARQVAEYVQLHLTRIGKTKVSLESIPFDKIIEIDESWIEQIVTVSSMRLDVILREVFHLSRQKVNLYIQNQQVKVNWKIIDHPSFLCKEGDMLSMRGFGRCKIKRIEGQTKKEKWRLVIIKKK